MQQCQKSDTAAGIMMEKQRRFSLCDWEDKKPSSSCSSPLVWVTPAVLWKMTLSAQKHRRISVYNNGNGQRLLDTSLSLTSERSEVTHCPFLLSQFQFPWSAWQFVHLCQNVAVIFDSCFKFDKQMNSVLLPSMLCINNDAFSFCDWSQHSHVWTTALPFMLAQSVHSVLSPVWLLAPRGEFRMSFNILLFIYKHLHGLTSYYFHSEGCFHPQTMEQDSPHSQICSLTESFKTALKAYFYSLGLRDPGSSSSVKSHYYYCYYMCVF